jgi:Dockerin type I domain
VSGGKVNTPPRELIPASHLFPTEKTQGQAYQTLRISSQADSLTIRDIESGNIVSQIDYADLEDGTQIRIPMNPQSDLAEIDSVPLDHIVNIETGAGDDTISVAAVDLLLSDNLTLDGGDGFDRWQLNPGNLDLDVLDLLANATITNVEEIDLSDSPGHLRLDATKIELALQEIIVIRQALSATCEFIGDWTVEPISLVGREYAHVFRSANRYVKLINDSILRNPTNPLDADGNGKVTALDALLIVNQLSRQQAGAGESTSLANHHYFDTNGDGRVSALDALRIINSLNRAQPAHRESIDSLVTKLEEEGRLAAILMVMGGQKPY